MREWLAIATERTVVVRALKTAAFVGVVLIGINQGNVILSGGLTTESVVKMGLTLIVPYLVSTFSSVAAMREHRHARRSAPE